MLVAGALALSCAAACGGGNSNSGTPTSTPTTTAGGAAAQGKALAASKGCMSCHSLDGSSKVGPTWKGLGGSQAKLASGSAVTADDSDLRSSIEEPDKQIVDGYKAGVMSSTIAKGSVSDSDAAALVAYIKTLR